jgi:FKBP-type peptidyl-prolyl cis-trans isomerase
MSKTMIPLHAILTVTLTVSVPLIMSAGSPVSNGLQAQESKNQTMETTKSGLQYIDVRQGTGETPQAKQTCIVDYTGWLWEKGAKGKEFDSSKKRGEPFGFHVGNGEVIAGWDEGVSGMKVGGIRQLLIPPELAFGVRGSGGVIPANATLLYEVELLGVMQRMNGGLEYRDVKAGTGATPRAGQKCVVHYSGWLWRNAKGRKFDSSRDRGEPFSFRLGASEVIEGWDRGVATMKVGGKRELLIPSNLGYGEHGYPPDIPGNATLFFDLELLAVK